MNAGARRLFAAGFGGCACPLREALLGLGYLAIEVDRIEDAASEIEAGASCGRTILLPTGYPDQAAARGLERLRGLSCAPPHATVVGTPPAPPRLRRLRDAGVGFQLLDPYDTHDVALLLQLVSPPRNAPERRRAIRIPSALAATLESGTRSVAARVTRLSARGALVQTEAGARVGERVWLALTLDRVPLALRARVASTPPAPTAEVPRTNGDAGTRHLGLDFRHVSSHELDSLAGHVQRRIDACRC